MHCSVYKGSRRPDIYLFVPASGDFSAVPEALRRAMGELVPVVDLVLYPGRPLARRPATEVMRALLLRGCYVQLPPQKEHGEPAEGTFSSTI